MGRRQEQLQRLPRASTCRPGRSLMAASRRFCSCYCLLLAPTRFSRIGQKEDPDFTFRVMVVQVAVARRISAGDAGPGRRQDRAQAAGNAGARFRSLLHPTRLCQHLRQPQGHGARRGGGGRLLSSAQEDRRHPPAASPKACSVPSSTTSSAIPISRSTPSPARATAIPSSRTFAKNCARYPAARSWRRQG